LVRERAGSGQGPIYNRLATRNRLPVHLPGGECPGKNPACRRPWTAFAARELVKRTMTYRDRSLVKCVLTNLRFNQSNAQRHNRNGYWSNAQRHNRNDHWSNVPQEAARIRPRLEPETCLTQHPTVGSLRPQYSAARIHRRTEKCPGSDAGALQADDTSLLACQSVQPGLALIMPGEDDVDLGIGRDRDHDMAGDTQAHQFGVAFIADVLRHSFAQKVSFR
jgi:hypothetical protein